MITNMERTELRQSCAQRASAAMLPCGAFLSAMVVFLVFFSARNYQFVALDDYAYVVNNPHIAKLDWGTVGWAFTTFHEGNWHPLTLLSLAVDHYFWGLDPFGYHLTNTVLHSLSVLIVCHLFFVLLRATRSRQAEVGKNERGVVVGSIAGALFWGLHPLRVESVVWISERKDVLCLLFMVSAVWWYLRYTCEFRSRVSSPFWRSIRYWISLILTGLALMSKSLAVSMPLILCIIDWYPLGRWSARANFIRTQIDKIPFVLLSLIISAVAIRSQQGAIKVFDELDLLSRVLVACKALFFYLEKTVWPVDLGPFYGHPGNVASTALGEYLVFALLVAGLLLAVILLGRRWPMWPALLGYYTITLLPMLGLVQVGGQWGADRYSYLPALGLSLAWGGAVAWLVNHRYSGRPAKDSCFVLLLIGGQLLIYSVLTVWQIPTWRTTETVTTRIIELQPHRHGEVYYVRAAYRNRVGLHQLALADIGEAMRSALQHNRREVFSKIAFTEASILKNLGRMPEALAMAEWGAQIAIVAPAAEDIALLDELRRSDGRKQRAKK